MLYAVLYAVCMACSNTLHYMLKPVSRRSFHRPQVTSIAIVTYLLLRVCLLRVGGTHWNPQVDR